jgi:CheY-like chemotaxis protein
MKRYLLIDDDDVIQLIHRKVVERHDPTARVDVAKSVDEALGLLLAGGEDALPDVVFLDINMPIKNGFAFVEGIRDDHPVLFMGLQRKSRVFLLTSSVNPRDMERANACFLLERLISKPLSRAVLEELEASEPLTQQGG